ncbi:SAM-dependent methyltransferase [Halobacteriales archaeon QS_4_69_225]|nr:MAG: SAM-dependent methyltransferase [Halobacteriales archaeon QS_4_69_225]
MSHVTCHHVSERLTIPVAVPRTVEPDPLGRAIRDHHRGERTHPLVDRDGGATREHPIERFYFEPVADDPDIGWVESWLSGPLLEVGAGAGRHALYFQERLETVATDLSRHLVAVMDDRGVADARRADMFSLRAVFDDGRFRSVFARGTQACLADSPAELRRFLADLAAVTTRDGTAVLDGFDPGHERAPELFGHRPDPEADVARRCYHQTYEGAVGKTLSFRLVGPDRLRAAAEEAGWQVADVRRGDPRTPHYQAALAKSGIG